MAHTVSPLRYPGGKSALASFLTDIIYANNLAGCTYIEPFCGGAGAALQLLFSGTVSRIILNDADPSIYAFWKSVLHNTHDFIRMMYDTPITVEHWKYQKSIFENNNSDIFKRGFAVFFLNRCNRSGILSANPIGGITQNSKWKIDARFNKAVLERKIHLLSSYKDRIILSNEDIFTMLSKDIVQRENTLIFFDPPYIRHGPKLYMNSFDIQQHEKLAQKLRTACIAPWVMTYDDSEYIRQLYSPWCEVSCFILNHHAHKTKKGQELFIRPHCVATTRQPVPRYDAYRRDVHAVRLSTTV